MNFTGPVYDFLKYLAQIVLPALGTAYYGLAAIWHFPNADSVSGTVLIVDTLLGALLFISSKSYEKNAKYDGAMNVAVDTEGKKTISLELEGDPDELDKKSEITFKVVKT